MLKTILLFVHLASFALSFGLVIFCDFVMVSVPLKGQISKKQLELLKLTSGYIFKALTVLIVSGLSFLVYYYFKTPESLANPKLYVKMIVVTVLSMNGYWLHKKGILILEKGLHQDLRSEELTPQLRKLLLSGGLSGLSWWTAFFLGTFKELNFQYSFSFLFSVYLLMIAGLVASVEGFLRIRHLKKGTGQVTRLWA